MTEHSTSLKKDGQQSQMYGFGDGKYYSEHLGNPLIYAKIGDIFPSQNMKFLNRSVVSEMSLWVGLFGLLTGLIGLMVISSSNKFHYTMTFMCLSFLIGILMIVVGSVNIKYGDDTEAIYTDLCISQKSEVNEIRRVRSQNIDQIMCSERCPCWSGY